MKNIIWVLALCIGLARCMEKSGQELYSSSDLEYGNPANQSIISPQLELQGLVNEIHNLHNTREDNIERYAQTEIQFLRKTVACLGCIAISAATLTVFNLLYHP